MNHKAVISCLPKGLHVFFAVALVATLVISLLPGGTASAQEMPSSDLVVSFVSIPKHVKACQLFEVTFRVTNLGPDPAANIATTVFLPDPFSFVGYVNAPAALAVGETVTFSAVMKVTAFVPGEPRLTWLGIEMLPDPALSVDPNTDDNSLSTNIRMIAKPVMACEP